MIKYFICIILYSVAFGADGKPAKQSFIRDFIVKINCQNPTNLSRLREISFTDKLGRRDSLDLLELFKDRKSGLFLVSRDIFEEVKTFLREKRISFEIMKNDLDRKIKFEQTINRRQYFKARFQRTEQGGPSYYMRFIEIKQWLNEKAKQVSFMKLETLGYSEENRDIILVKVDVWSQTQRHAWAEHFKHMAKKFLRGRMSKDDSKPILWVDAGIHAREWISPSTAIFLINKLLENDKNSVKLLEDYQIYILPLLNPDGYEYTHEVNRMWRKNRVSTSLEECKGVDLNRNYPYHWGENGASPEPCSRIYQGSSPSSEKETKAVISKLTEIKANVKLFITLHSFGQYIMSPYGYSRNRYPRQYYKLMSMGTSVSSYLQETYGRTYQVGSSANLLYEASGASDDYASGELRIPYSYTIELPDRGRYGFLLPPTYINSVGNQFYDTLIKFTENLSNL